MNLKGVRKIAAVTAYDFSFGYIAARSKLDLVLVGDSMGMVVMGNSSTTSVKLDDIARATEWTRRGIDRAEQEGFAAPLLVADMTLDAMRTPEKLLAHSQRLVNECGADAVKIEGGKAIATDVARLVGEGIVVVGHAGLLPQQVSKSDGFRMQGKTKEQADILLEDTQALADAGVIAIVLELVTSDVAEFISSQITPPTIGIGSGKGCDGQIQVLHDLLGFTVGRRPRHAGTYMQAGATMQTALESYAEDVRNGVFEPSEKIPSLRNV